jgi:long-chain acyl-CoA synthetase
MKNFSTIAELALYQAYKFNNAKALNFNQKSFSNQEFLDRAFYFACGLREIGFKKNQTFAIVSNSNPTWLIVDFGAILAGAITVPIFHNISSENLAFEIKDADIKFIFSDNQEILKQNLAVEKIIDEKYLQDLILLGKKAVEEKRYDLEELTSKIKPEDLATIIYTSGSTGTPKGVELTHQNLISQIKATAEVFPLEANNDIVLSFLPLAHIFERMVMMFYISQGVSIHFCDDIKNLGELLKKIRPTLMTSVPRMLEKVFVKIKDGAEQKNGLAKFLAFKAINQALHKNILSKKNLIDKFFDLLVYKKFRLALGGRMRMIICGGAALSCDMEKFYRNIGINIFCGYGLTETSPVIAVNHAKAWRCDTVGQSFPGVKVKVADDSELLVSGPGVMKGYHNNPEKTAETMDGTWFKTGDLAKIDEEGFIKIIGRKKELFKTANGKYVAPIPIEQKLIQELGFLVGSIIIAEGRKFTSCLLFPDFEILAKFKKKMNSNLADLDFLKSEPLQSLVLSKINKINQNLDHWQQIQKFHIAVESISIESGEITPSMKLKRNVLEEKYKNIIDSFYKE